MKMTLNEIPSIGWTKFSLGYTNAIQVIINQLSDHSTTKDPLTILPLYFLIGHGLELMLKSLKADFKLKIVENHAILSHFEDLESELRHIARGGMNLEHNINNCDIDNLKKFIRRISIYYPIVVRYPYKPTNKGHKIKRIPHDLDKLKLEVTHAFSTLRTIQFINMYIENERLSFCE